MRSLSDTLSRIAVLRVRPKGGAARPVKDRLSDLSGFGSNPGGLRARTYAPDGLPEGAPLVVVLHGCTQSAAAYDQGSGWSRLADRERFSLLFPEQTKAGNPNLCFNWFAPAHIRRGQGEALSIRQMIEAAATRRRSDRRRIFVTGLSAGGAMASVMLAAYPEVFRGGAIIAGLPYGCAATVQQAFDRMRGHAIPAAHALQSSILDASPHQGPWPKISVWHGSSDRMVDPSNMEAILSQWRGVLQVEKSPSYTRAVNGFPRRVWRTSDGREALEAYSITGMGHGAPLATTGPDGIGERGPFMLECGISSTLQIARFWEIAPSASDADYRATRPSPLSLAADAPRAGGRSALRDRDEEEMAWAPPPLLNGAGSVKRTIEDALRAAGLM